MGALFEKYKSEILADVEPAPCGMNPTHSELWETIQEEIAKVPPFSGDPDWTKVENDCVSFLSGTSKDLRIMNALTEALVRNHGLSGLIDGFHLCATFYEKYWESMYPKKKKDKAMGSFSNKLDILAPQITSTTHEPLKLALASLNELKTCLAKVNTKFINPSFSKLRERLETTLIQLGPEHKEVKEEPKKAAQAPTQTPAAAPAAASPPPSAPTPAAPPPAVAAAPTPAPAAPQAPAPAAPAADAPIKDQLSVLRTISTNIRTQSPHLAISYRLLRISCWTQAKLPRRSEGFETFILSPGELVSDSLKNMADQGSWNPLLLRCETLMDLFPYWLDVQYYAARAAQALGPDFEEVLSVIEEESCALAERFPELQELKFNDGLPFALPLVKEWLDRLVREAKIGSGGAEDPAATLKSELAGQGDEFAKALKLAQASIDDTENPLDRFRMKLAVASFALSVNQAAWALHILKGLIAIASAHHLKFWEPKLVARLWVETVKAAKTPELEKQNAELLLQAKTELAELDLASIAVLSG